MRKMPSVSYIKKNGPKNKAVENTTHPFFFIIFLRGIQPWCTIQHCFKTIPDLSMQANPTVPHTHPPPGKTKGLEEPSKKPEFLWKEI